MSDTTQLEKRRAIVARHKGPKSVCRCGHMGDAPGDGHAGVLGHGACQTTGCECEKFTWDKWAPALQKKLDRAQP